MSRRRLEQGGSAASSFSLRALSTGAAPAAAPMAAMPSLGRPGPPPSVAAAAPALNFRFSSLGIKAPTQAAVAKPTAAPAQRTRSMARARAEARCRACARRPRAVHREESGCAPTDRAACY